MYSDLPSTTDCGWCEGSGSYCILGTSTGPTEGSCGTGIWDFFECRKSRLNGVDQLFSQSFSKFMNIAARISGLTFVLPTGSNCQFNCDGTFSALSMLGPDAPTGCATSTWTGTFMDPVPSGDELTSFKVSFDLFFWEDFAGGTDALSVRWNTIPPHFIPYAESIHSIH